MFLRLSRGTVLRESDILQSETGGSLVRVIAKPEPVLTVTPRTPLDLLRAGYHLGNRHVPLKINETYLRLSAEPLELQVSLSEATAEILALEDDDLNSCGWGLALASMAHETQYTLLFRS